MAFSRLALIFTPNPQAKQKGRIPANGSKTIYLGFENERVRYTNYLWVEAEAVVPTTEYYTTKYTAK